MQPPMLWPINTSFLWSGKRFSIRCGCQFSNPHEAFRAPRLFWSRRFIVIVAAKELLAFSLGAHALDGNQFLSSVL